jgi:hypothetical protein
MAAMTVMIFLLGLLIGILGGGALCVRYLRKEIAADIGPSLGRVQMQLENLDAEVDLVLATRLAELSRAHLQVPTPPGGSTEDPQPSR